MTLARKIIIENIIIAFNKLFYDFSVNYFLATLDIMWLVLLFIHGTCK